MKRVVQLALATIGLFASFYLKDMVIIGERIGHNPRLEVDVSNDLRVVQIKSDQPISITMTSDNPFRIGAAGSVGESTTLEAVSAPRPAGYPYDRYYVLGPVTMMMYSRPGQIGRLRLWTDAQGASTKVLIEVSDNDSLVTLIDKRSDGDNTLALMFALIFAVAGWLFGGGFYNKLKKATLKNAPAGIGTQE